MPEDFWGLTPWQFKVCLDAYQIKVEAEHNSKLWHTWHGAAFQRAKTMPKLSTIMHKKEAPKGIDEAAIKARFMAYKQRFEDDRR